MSKIKGSTALVTGANRGIGRHFVTELLAAGATKVYATARNIESLTDLQAQSDGRVEVLQLDVTQPDEIEKAAVVATDVSLLVNNAGIATFSRLVGAEKVDLAQLEMDVNYFGVLNVIRAFSPVLAANGGGVMVNMSSITGLVNFPALGSYSASKAATHSLIQGVRGELAGQGTQVVGVYPGPVNTEMGANIPMDKASPSLVVQEILTGIEAGIEDIFPDPTSRQMRENLSADAKGVEKHVAAMLA